MALGQRSDGLLNHRYVKEVLLKEAKWSESHGAIRDIFLGAGMLYYAIPYMLRARICVCLGSGSGFVPRMMVQAHRDMLAAGWLEKDNKVVLVDANIGPWGRPVWLTEDSYFRKTFPEVEILFETTEKAAKLLQERGIWINYLHVDADHSKEGVLSDLRDYVSLMTVDGIITLHDTDPARRNPKVSQPPSGALDGIEAFAKECAVDVVNFPSVGCGTAIMVVRKK